MSPEIIILIRRMCRENPTWGAPRICSELRLLGYDVVDSTVTRYMIQRHHGLPSQSWRTFFRNHLRSTAACDLFVVPTVTFRLLFCFVILSHDRRRIVHFNATAHPTAEWTAQQIIEAFPGEGTEPRYLLREHDAIYCDWFRRRVAGLGIKEIITSPQSPWQNPYPERVIGSVRREYLDHLTPHEVPVFVARDTSVPSWPRLPAVAGTGAPLRNNRAHHERVAAALTRLLPAERNFR